MKKTLIFILFIGGLMMGCRTFPPIRNIENQSTPIHQQQQIEKAIISGATSRGWVANKVQNGLIEATLKIRSHHVVVDIPYNIDHYSILYKHSENLHYNEKKGTIHPRYNTWIIYLNRSINQELVRLQ